MAELLSVNLRSMPKTMENVRDWCIKMCGITGAPLAYMMCVKIMPENEAYALEESFNSIDNEMIERAPIIDLSNNYDTENKDDEELEVKGPFVASLQIDQVTLYHKIHEVYGQTEC